MSAASGPLLAAVDELLTAIEIPAECENVAMPEGLPKQETNIITGRPEWRAEWKATCGTRIFRYIADRLCEGLGGKCRDEANVLAALVADVEKFYRDLLADKDYQRFLCDPGGGDDEALCKRKRPDAQIPREDIGVMAVMVPPGDRDAGMGSGSPGSAKVFLDPLPNDRRVQVDDVYVIIHELHHAHGSDTEFDPGSDLAALAYHLSRGNVFNRRQVDYEIESNVLLAMWRPDPKHARTVKRARKMVKFLHDRWPDQVEASLRRKGWRDSDIEQFRARLKEWS